jgi:TM2 domain-containing membrane protein YozV
VDGGPSREQIRSPTMYGPPNPYGVQGYPQPPQRPQYPQYPYAPLAVAPNPYAPYGVHPLTGVPYSDKSKIAAGLLQIFLGKFGVGRFYTGHTGLAVAQLVTCLLGVWVLSWVTCGATIAVLLWPIIDGIIILSTESTDALGRPLRP